MNPSARSMSVRAKANNLAKKLGIAPQAALQAWFAERFLARVAMSGHADRIVVKGGTLMAALFGLAERTTMDIDATVLDTRGDEATLRAVLAEICAVDAGDGISYALGPGETIRKDDEYGGVGFTLVATLGTIRLTLGIDMTVGDAIVPGPEPLEGGRTVRRSSPHPSLGLPDGNPPRGKAPDAFEARRTDDPPSRLLRHPQNRL